MKREERKVKQWQEVARDKNYNLDALSHCGGL